MCQCMINSSLKWRVFPAWNLFSRKSLYNQVLEKSQPSCTLAIFHLAKELDFETYYRWAMASHYCCHFEGLAQCARTDWNKRLLPKPMTTTGWKGTPWGVKILMNWNTPRWVPIYLTIYENQKISKNFGSPWNFCLLYKT